MRIILGLIMVVGGMLLAMKASWIVQNFGYSEFAESKLRSFGGTRLMWKFIGIIAIVSGCLVVTDTYGDVILWIFRPLLGGMIQSGI